MKTIIVSLVLLIVLFIFLYRRARKVNVARELLEDYLVLLAGRFYAAINTCLIKKHMDIAKKASTVGRYVSYPEQRLKTLLENLKTFPSNNRNHFGHGIATDDFIALMLPDLKNLYTKYRNTKGGLTEKECNEALSEAAKKHTTELLNQI